MSPLFQNRYPGVQPFRNEQQHLFFGRDEDAFRLLSQVTGEKLTVLFGKSGYGKSSLIEAGLFPALERENAKGKRFFLPISIRFNAYSETGDQLFEKYRFHRQQAIDQYNFTKASQLPELPATLWGDWKSFELPENTVIVLAFDQFEEFFTYPREQQDAFKIQLSELLYSGFPQYLEEREDELDHAQFNHLSQPLEARALFAIRSDRLSELNNLKDYLPAILHKRMELGPLGPEQARLAITGPARYGSQSTEQAWLKENGIAFHSPAFEYQEAALEQLLAGLQRSNLEGQHGVEAFLLQVLCNEIENRAAAGEIKDIDNNDLPDVTVADLPDVKMVFSQYYERRLSPLGSEEQEVAKKVIENGLVQINETGQGRRLSVDGGALLNNYGKLGLTEALLEQLVQTYLLRREPNSLGGLNYELSHDTLLEPVVAARKAREKKEEENARNRQLIEERRKRRRANSLAFAVSVLALIAIAASIIAFRQSQLALAKTRQAEAAEQRALQEADAAREAEGRTRQALEDFQRVQAEKVLAEVDDILSRAEDMKSKGYLQQYLDLVNDAARAMEEYEGNPFLEQKQQEVRAMQK